MPSSDKPLAYLVLGAASSGRREILADLIEGGLADGNRAAVLLSEGELASVSETVLPYIACWSWHDGAISATPPPDATHIFFVTDGRANPVDQIEAFQLWLVAHNLEIARVLCVVNCSLVEKHPPLAAWFDACIHFSDVVLLNRREGVANKWLSDFLARYQDQFYPCLFEMVKAGRVKNPALILEPQARRIAQLFDEAPPDWRAGLSPETIVEDEAEEDDEEDADGENNDEGEGDVAPGADPWLARDAAAGRRARPLPDITGYLPPV
jgi:hypothetical protein